MIRPGVSLLTAALVCLLAWLPLAAQETKTEEAHPLLEMMRAIPDVTESYAGVPWFSYLDHRALEQAREGVPTYERYADLLAARDAEDPAANLWLANTVRMTSGWEGMTRVFQRAQEMPPLVGFDLFDVDRSLVAGEPPSRIVVLQGDFDDDAIIDAFVARDYEVVDANGATLLRSADGGEGFRQDLRNRDPANPFGGDLGRRERIALVEDLLLNSADDALVDAMIASALGEERSVLDRDNFVAAAEAITAGEGLLVQAQFFSPLDVGILPPDVMALMLQPGATLEVTEDMLTPQAVREFEPLPAYNLVVLADRQEGENQVALAAMVYDEEADALAAAEEMTRRLAAFRHPQRDDPDSLMTLYGGAAGEPSVVYSEATDRYVALASIVYPSPSNERVSMLSGEPLAEDSDEPGTYAPAGRLFRDWISAIYQRAFAPLAITE